jgi:hypothetical protein
MAEAPPLNRIYVLGYSANDRDFPIASLTADPRVAGYQVPKDLSACPDKRYPNHLFTGAQPISGDQRVRHVWEILPSPWVPFTRYDDDLGPVQGRRRSVKNEEQVATLSSSKRTTYEGREGSAIVLTETEESWSIKTDANGNSLFPVKTRNFYDPSRGDVKETRQLIVATGKETATLVNVIVPEPSQRNRTIQRDQVIQTTYEPYNQFLSFKIVQTYRVAGPLLIGQSTNNEGQLVAVTTQRKNASGYRAPNPTATKTVEVNREDAASIVERVVDAPRVFSGKTFSIERPDPVPEKFRIAIPSQTQQETIAGTATTPPPLNSTEISKSEQQLTEFVKRITTTSRTLPINPESNKIIQNTVAGAQFTTEMGGGWANVAETFPFTGTTPPTSVEFGTVADEIENLGNGQSIRRTVKLPAAPTVLNFGDDQQSISATTLPLLRGQEYDDSLDIVIPFQQVTVSPQTTQLSTGARRRVTPRDVAHSTVVKYNVEDVQEALDNYYWELPEMVQVALPDKLISVSCPAESSGGNGSGEGIGDTFFYNYSSSSTQRGKIVYDIEEGFRGNIPALRAVFFLPKENCSPQRVLEVVKERSQPLPPPTPIIGDEIIDPNAPTLPPATPPPHENDIRFYPNARPQAHELVVLGTSASAEVSRSVSFDSASNSESKSGGVSIDTTTIPPTIHNQLTITTAIPSSATGSSTSEPTTVIGSDGVTRQIIETTSKASSYVFPNVLAATQPYSQFPTGKFIYQINSTPYRFGYVRVEAVIVEITSEYV